MKLLVLHTTVPCLLLVGCATPPPVIEQANVGVSMIAELEEALKNYRTQQARSEQYLTFALSDGQARLSHLRELSMREQLSLNAAASPDAAKVQARLLALTKGLAEARASRVPASEYEVSTKKLLAPLPSTAEATSAAQAAMAQLSKELPTETRIKEAKALIDAVRSSLKDAKKQVRDAEAAAAAATP
jgi:hypothetical protein